jgi:hypothetical protein
MKKKYEKPELKQNGRTPPSRRKTQPIKTEVQGNEIIDQSKWMSYKNLILWH